MPYCVHLGGRGKLGGICQTPSPVETRLPSPWSPPAWWWEGIPGWWCICLRDNGLGEGYSISSESLRVFSLCILPQLCHQAGQIVPLVTPAQLLCLLTSDTSDRLWPWLQLHVLMEALPVPPHPSQGEQRMVLLLAPLWRGCFCSSVGGHHLSYYQCCKIWSISNERVWLVISKYQAGAILDPALSVLIFDGGELFKVCP